jgi:hypothetical protein
MKNAVLFGIFAATIILAIIIGANSSGLKSEHAGTAGMAQTQADSVPYIGQIQILNGCGMPGIAWQAADMVRAAGFDVKNDGIGNAATFNYASTLVLSRTKDMTVARQVGTALKVAPDKVILMRTGDDRFDVTVILGADFKGTSL